MLYVYGFYNTVLIKDKKLLHFKVSQLGQILLVDKTSHLVLVFTHVAIAIHEFSM